VEPLPGILSGGSRAATATLPGPVVGQALEGLIDDHPGESLLVQDLLLPSGESPACSNSAGPYAVKRSRSWVGAVPVCPDRPRPVPRPGCSRRAVPRLLGGGFLSLAGEIGCSPAVSRAVDARGSTPARPRRPACRPRSSPPTRGPGRPDIVAAQPGGGDQMKPRRSGNTASCAAPATRARTRCPTTADIRRTRAGIGTARRRGGFVGDLLEPHNTRRPTAGGL